MKLLGVERRQTPWLLLMLPLAGSVAAGGELVLRG